MNFSATPYRAFKKLFMQINTLTMSFYSVLIYFISLHLLNTLFTALSYISRFISLSLVKELCFSECQSVSY